MTARGSYSAMVTSNGSTLSSRQIVRLAYFRASARASDERALLQIEQVSHAAYRASQLTGPSAGPIAVSESSDGLTEADADAWFQRQVQRLCGARAGRLPQYEHVDVTPLEAPLSELRSQGVDTYGVTLFLRIEADPLPLILSLAEYVRLCPTADLAGSSRILSYQARATIESALHAADLGGGALSSPEAFARCFRALDQTGLADVGFVIGHRDSNHQFVQGFPAGI